MFLLFFFLFSTVRQGGAGHSHSHSAAAGAGGGLGRNHTVVSVCGWPQSGTSLVHEIVERLDGTSTMIDKCTQVNNERNCIGFNYESQWLLRNKDKYLLFSGAMCPLDRSDVTPQGKASMLERWTALWDMNKPYLISKSPANMMKIPFIHSTFEEAANTRHVVVIKHPATLNIALPKKITWEMILMVYNPSDPNKPKQQNSIQFTEQQAKRVKMATYSIGLKTLLNLLRSRAEQRAADALNMSTTTISSLKCEKGSEGGGWLSSMSHLANWLRMNAAFAKDNVRILRFEDIVNSPLRVCLHLTSFVYHGHEPRLLKIFTDKDVIGFNKPAAHLEGEIKGKEKKFHHEFRDIVSQCQTLFRANKMSSPVQRSSSRRNAPRERSSSRGKGNVPRGPHSGHQQLRHLRIQQGRAYAFSSLNHNATGQESSRVLRMHMNEDGTRANKWTFSTFGAMKSCAPRIFNFNKVLQLGRNKNDPSARQLLQLDVEMRRFGYGIGHRGAYPYSSSPTVFDEWDLMAGSLDRRSPA